MDLFAFIASLVQSLAWPFSVVLIVFILRKSLASLLPALQKLKFKDVELEFGRQLDVVRKELGAESVVSTPPPGEAARILPPTKGTAGYYRSLAEVSPRAAILEAWLGFELTANAAYAQVQPSPRRVLSMPRLFEVLGEAQLLTGSEIEALTILRGLRNEVVHGPEPTLSTEAIGEYAALLQRITDDLQARASQRSGPSV